MSALHHNPFQVVLLLVIAGLLAGGIVGWVRGWIGRRDGIIWLLFWLAGALAVLWPDVTSRVARLLGIGRGADLVFYCAIVVLLSGIWMLYLRLRQMRREITLLVRHVALLEAERDSGAGAARSDPAQTTARARPDS